jgi:hypothetical protein
MGIPCAQNIIADFVISGQCGQNIMGPKHHLKALKHQTKTPPKNLKKTTFWVKNTTYFLKIFKK